jgi:hypothetical protein
VVLATTIRPDAAAAILVALRRLGPAGDWRVGTIDRPPGERVPADDPDDGTDAPPVVRRAWSGYQRGGVRRVR